MNKRCPKCNGKAVLLKKMESFKVNKNSLEHIETYQLYRCKRCKEEFR